MYVTSLFTLASVVDLTSLYSRPPLFFPTLGFTSHQGQKRSFDQTREPQEVLQNSPQTIGWGGKKVLSRTDFAFCLTVPLRHSSCQTGGTDCCFEPMEYAWPHNMAAVMNITVESCAYAECIPILRKDLGQ